MATKLHSYDEFLGQLQTLKQRGYLPIVGGFRQTFPRGWYISTFFQASAGADKVENVLYGDGAWTDEDFVLGAREARRVAEEGYLIKEAQSLDNDAALQLWLNNPMAVMSITGTWVLPDLIESDETFDFFALPAINDALAPGLIGGLGSGFAVSKSAEDLEAVGKVLDVMFSKEVQERVTAEVGYINPFAYPVDDWNLHPYVRRAAEILFDPDTDMGYNLSVVTPSAFVDVYYAGIQGLTLGRLTAEEFVKQLQAAWEAAQ